MKTANKLFLCSVLALAILFGCKSDATKSFIQGTYVNHSSGTYSIADDTLSIASEGTDNFTIHRSTGFNLFRDGKRGKCEHETETWNAIYHGEDGTLVENRFGKVLVFYPDSGKMIIGKREYKKIN